MARPGRRAFLGGVAAAIAASRMRSVAALVAPRAQVLGAPPFTLGIASGDPAPDGVVLWTRLAPDPLDVSALPAVDVPVRWEVATDAAFARVVASGVEPAVAALAHSVHVEVDGLEPDTWYWYRFEADGWVSPAGRTRTLPPAGCTPEAVSFAFASCQNYPAGYYGAHDHLAAEPLDLVFFLGDYIYEGGGRGPVRAHNSGEVKTLDAYRNRYGLYKSDPSLQAAHAAFPWVVTWDDHEVDNNYAGEHDQDGSAPAAFLARRALAYQAWYEHQPVCIPVPAGAEVRIYRRLEWGALASFFVLDTRQYRTDQPCGDSLQAPCPERDDPAATLLGAEQEAWLADGLVGSPAVWHVLAQQVVFANMRIGGVKNALYNMDQWDGYPAAQQRLLDVLARPEVTNPLVVTGDIHLGGTAELHAISGDASSPVVGTELIGTSISSGSDGDATSGIIAQAIDVLPWWRDVDARHRGYVTVRLTPEAMHAEHRVVESVLVPTSPIATRAVVDVVADPAGVAGCPAVAAPAKPVPPPGAGSAGAGSLPSGPGPVAPAATPVPGAPDLTG